MKEALEIARGKKAMPTVEQYANQWVDAHSAWQERYDSFAARPEVTPMILFLVERFLSRMEGGLSPYPVAESVSSSAVSGDHGPTRELILEHWFTVGEEPELEDRAVTESYESSQKMVAKLQDQ